MFGVLNFLLEKVFRSRMLQKFGEKRNKFIQERRRRAKSQCRSLREAIVYKFLQKHADKFKKSKLKAHKECTKRQL
jgi:hypothetical protein